MGRPPPTPLPPPRGPGGLLPRVRRARSWRRSRAARRCAPAPTVTVYAKPRMMLSSLPGSPRAQGSLPPLKGAAPSRPRPCHEFGRPQLPSLSGGGGGGRVGGGSSHPPASVSPPLGPAEGRQRWGARGVVSRVATSPFPRGLSSPPAAHHDERRDVGPGPARFSSVTRPRSAGTPYQRPEPDRTGPDRRYSRCPARPWRGESAQPSPPQTVGGTCFYGHEALTKPSLAFESLPPISPFQGNQVQSAGCLSPGARGQARKNKKVMRAPSELLLPPKLLLCPILNKVPLAGACTA